MSLSLLNPAQLSSAKVSLRRSGPRSSPFPLLPSLFNDDALSSHHQGRSSRHPTHIRRLLHPPFAFIPGALPLSYPSRSSNGTVASYGFNDEAESTSPGRRELVVGCDDGTPWIVPWDDQDEDTQGGGGVLEGAGGGIIAVGGSSSSTSFPPLPTLPEIATTDDSSPELFPLPLSPNNRASTISPTHRFPRPRRPSSRSSSPKPTLAHHLRNPLLPHATPTGRNRVLSTSSIASNHTAYSIATNTTPPPPASASTLVNKGRIVSGLSATVAAPPTITTGEETLGERKEELIGLLE